MAPPTRILVVRFSSLGDVILTTPLIRALRARYPDAHLAVVTRAAYADVFRYSRRVDQLETLAPGEPVALLADRLGRAWDLRIDLQGSVRGWRVRRALGGPWRRVRRRRLTRRLFIAVGRTPSPPLPHAAEQYFTTVQDDGIVPDGRPAEVFTSPADEAAAATLAPPGTTVLAPGASWATKRWPPAYWRALARRLHDAGHTVVGVGTEEEAALLGSPAVPAFGAGLAVTAALLRSARVAVTNDSGLMHLASAVGTPVVALFGPTVPAFGFTPYAHAATVLERPMACRPCTPQGGPRCPLGHHRCMLDLDPAIVAEAAA